MVWALALEGLAWRNNVRPNYADGSLMPKLGLTCIRHLQSLYLLMEPALGGELYKTYKKEKFHGKVEHVNTAAQA